MGKQVNPRVDVSPPKPSDVSFIGSSLIPVINKLQDIFAPLINDGGAGEGLEMLSLPQVAVVGSQSSGKSSVLEALVGRDFLPRGCGICTRRPLVLQLEHRPLRAEYDGREWGEFRHLPGKRFYNFSDIRREIQAETEREAGRNKGVSNKQIRLKISSPNVLNMTLVDLPGITKVPVGDQPSDIEVKIRGMIMSYIQKEMCIILAVSPANSDLATSDALQMARVADPTGSRTIGVISKLDIMDKGTDARNFLLGKVIPLHLGYVGVVNRSQEDINKDCSIAVALAHEEQFFRDHPIYNGLSDCCGIPQLAKKMNQILEQHIQQVFPCLKAELNSHLDTVTKELNAYGEKLKSESEKRAFLFNILTEYSNAFCAMVDGRSPEMSTKELAGGARINYVFQSIFVKRLEEVNPCEDVSDEDIGTALQNATGPRNALFVPEVPFEVLVRRQIARLLDPSLQCLRYVYDELIKVSRNCEPVEIQRFPMLRKHLDDVVRKLVRDGVEPAERMIGNLIEMEMGYINSSHPSFIGGKQAVEIALQHARTLQDDNDVDNVSVPEKDQIAGVLRKSITNGAMTGQASRLKSYDARAAPIGNSTSKTWGISSIFRYRWASRENASGKPAVQSGHCIEQIPSRIELREPPSTVRPLEAQTGHEAVDIMATKLLLTSYYNIVRKNIQDLVPKAIMHFLVNHIKRRLLGTLLEKMCRENLCEELLQECDEVAIRRKQTEEMFLLLQQAVETLDKVEADISSGRLGW